MGKSSLKDALGGIEDRFKDTLTPKDLLDFPSLDDGEGWAEHVFRASPGYGAFMGEKEGDVKDAVRSAEQQEADRLAAIHAANVYDREANRNYDRPSTVPGLAPRGSAPVGGMMMPGTPEFDAYRNRTGLNRQIGSVLPGRRPDLSRSPTRTNFGPVDTSVPGGPSPATPRGAPQGIPASSSLVDNLYSRPVPAPAPIPASSQLIDNLYARQQNPEFAHWMGPQPPRPAPAPVPTNPYADPYLGIRADRGGPPATTTTAPTVGFMGPSGGLK